MTGERGTWMVKLPESKGSATLDRREISWRGRRVEVPAEACALLRGVVRRADLDQVVEMETTRLPWTLHDQAGTQWAELAYDDITIVGGPQDGLRFREIGIERTGESTDDRPISAMAKALRRAGAEPEDQPKLAKAMGLPADQRQRLTTKSPRNWTATDVVRYAIFDGLERLLDHDYRLRLRFDNPDSHDVHQARVATRRLRSHLKTFRPLLDPMWLTHTEDELRWMGLVLGAVRDADVMEKSLTYTGDSKPQLPASNGLGDLRAKLTAQRANAVTDFGDALDSQRYLDLLDRLHAAASNPPLTSSSDKTPKPPRATEVLPKVVSRRWRRIQKKVKVAGASPSNEQLHQIRIAAKNLRYACELSRPVIGKAAKKTAKAAEDIQTILGDHHDASASIDWLTRTAATGSGRAGFAAGMVAAGQDRQRQKLAKEWHHAWAELSRPARRRWLA